MTSGNSQHHLPEQGSTFGLMIVGAGPAGLAPLLAAAKAGLLPDVLAAGVIIVDRDRNPGAGRLGQYVISSDSSADTFLSCVRDSPVPELADLAETPLARAIALYGPGCVSLELAGEFMTEVGAVMTNLIAASPRGHVATQTNVEWIQNEASGAWQASLRDLDTSETRQIHVASVLISTGATQHRDRLRGLPVDGTPLLPRYDSKLTQSDEFLRRKAFPRFISTLKALSAPKIAIVGGSTSAMSCARQLLLALADQQPPPQISILCRRPVTLFYPSREAAYDDGYTQFSESDICPLSGFVHRFGGFRFESRILARQLLKVGDAEPEPRVALHRLHGGADPEATRLLDEADLVIACLGYRPAGLPVRDRDGHTISLAGLQEDRSLVNECCGIIDSAGRELPGLYGIGLACGFTPGATMGGEPSFHGQVNGLWLWQNDIGLMLIRRILSHISKKHTEIAPHAERCHAKGKLYEGS